MLLSAQQPGGRRAEKGVVTVLQKYRAMPRKIKMPRKDDTCGTFMLMYDMNFIRQVFKFQGRKSPATRRLVAGMSSCLPSGRTRLTTSGTALASSSNWATCWGDFPLTAAGSNVEAQPAASCCVLIPNMVVFSYGLITREVTCCWS